VISHCILKYPPAAGAHDFQINEEDLERVAALIRNLFSVKAERHFLNFFSPDELYAAQRQWNTFRTIMARLGEPNILQQESDQELRMLFSALGGAGITFICVLNHFYRRDAVRDTLDLVEDLLTKTPWRQFVANPTLSQPVYSSDVQDGMNAIWKDFDIWELSTKMGEFHNENGLSTR
jgi:hypothetical protein